MRIRWVTPFKGQILWQKFKLSYKVRSPPFTNPICKQIYYGHPKRPIAKKREVTLERKRLQLSFEGLAVHEGSKTIQESKIF